MGDEEPPIKRARGERGGFRQRKRNSSKVDGGLRRGDEKVPGEGDRGGMRQGKDVIQRGQRGQPRSLPFQGQRGVNLNFNYWMTTSHCQVVTSEVQKLALSVLTGAPMPPAFVGAWGAGHSRNRPNRVVVACATGLAMASAERELMTGSCPFLATCSSIPVRHAFTLANMDRASDIQPSSALMLWGEKPSLTLKDIESLSIPELFSTCVLEFLAEKPLAWKDQVALRPDPCPLPQHGTSLPAPASRGGEGSVRGGDQGE
ncbi:unnamed protein product, partial [Discosporangium mesarthrocarpum]